MSIQLLVIRIEKIGEAVVEWPVMLDVRGQEESFKEPGCMRQVPFYGAGLRHGLNQVVVDGQQSRESFAGAAHYVVPSGKCAGSHRQSTGHNGHR